MNKGEKGDVNIVSRMSWSYISDTIDNYAAAPVGRITRLTAA